LDEIWDIITEGDADSIILIDEMEELLNQWLLNEELDNNNVVPGDLFPCGGYFTHWK
jgi:hypothetical protein